MLDIGVGYANDQSPSRMFASIELDDDGYYWFLHPLFERLAALTGEYIDLYGIAVFFGEDLTALERMLAEARELITAQPGSWEVYTGLQIRPVRKEIHKTVERERFIYLLDTWQCAIRAAKEHERPIVCFGD